MALSQKFVLDIEAPYAVAEAYLANPRNYPEWAAVDPNTYQQLPNGDWSAEVRFGGVRHIRFSPPNGDGIFDHAVFAPGDPLLWMPLRISPLEDGTTRLEFTFLQREGMSETTFSSAIEWINTDLMTLKTLIESQQG